MCPASPEAPLLQITLILAFRADPFPFFKYRPPAAKHIAIGIYYFKDFHSTVKYLLSIKYTEPEETVPSNYS